MTADPWTQKGWVEQSWGHGNSWSTQDAGWQHHGGANEKWSTHRHGWNDRNPSRDQSWGPPKHSLDRKDVAKPEPYDGDITKWVHWRSTFSRFLERQDDRWPSILKRIEEHKGKMISEDDEWQIDKEFNCWGIRPFKQQLLGALESYTSGETRRVVHLAEERGILSCWSRMADKGHSLRDKHVVGMRRRVMAPRTNVPAKDLELAILTWETEVLRFEEAADETFDEKSRLMFLTDMLPPVLRQRVEDLKGPGRFDTYEAVRAEALIWLADNVPMKGKLAGVSEVQDGDLPDIPYDDVGEYICNPDNAEAPPERLMQIVKNAHLKRTKGAGKGSGKDRGTRKCFECDSPDHIAAECPKRIARVAAGGPERLDDPMGIKGKGKKGKKADKLDKGGGKGGKGGVWSPHGNHGGFWMPSRSQIKGAGGFPYPTNHQYMHPWYPEGKGGQPGAKMMIENGVEVPEDWGWTQAPGSVMRLSQVPARAAVKTFNKFSALASEESEETPPQEPSEVREIQSVAAEAMRATTMPHPAGEGKVGAAGRLREAAAESTPMVPVANASWSRPRGCCGSTSSQCLRAHASGSIKTFIEKRTPSLRTLESKWEKFIAILDSGASVTVVPPHLGRDYEIVKGQAATDGVRYEIADGTEIPNLGEKLLPIMTREGTWRALKAEVADISKAVQSVWSLVKTGHRVVFGGGEAGNEHYIENVVTGEVNMVEDDGMNYFMTYYIAPRAQASFAGPTR